MIRRKEIVDFFNKEAEVAKLNWESLMKLSVEDRVAKRKAINDVFLDKESLDDSDENYRRLRLNINKNLSDFKEGDPVVLHTDGVQDIKCTISNFEGDSSIIVEVFPPNLPNSLEPYYDVPLVLDKDIVDLRPSVYNNFTSIISSEEAYWQKSLINTKAQPKFENISDCEVELEETCSSMGISLLMTAGDVDYMTEMADFLYSPNKLNIAFSRAKSKLIIVGNHSLLCNIKGNHQPLISQMLNSSHASIVQYNEYYV